MSVEVANPLEAIGFKPRGDGYSIPIPERANLYQDTVGRWATGARRDALALVVEDRDGRVARYSFGELAALSAKLARVLAGEGVGPGIPVAVHTGQSLETAIAHLAVYRLGGIVLTLSKLYGPDTVRHIL